MSDYRSTLVSPGTGSSALTEEEVVEISLLLPSWQASAQETTAHQRSPTAGRQGRCSPDGHKMRTFFIHTEFLTTLQANWCGSFSPPDLILPDQRSAWCEKVGDEPSEGRLEPYGIFGMASTVEESVQSGWPHTITPRLASLSLRASSMSPILRLFLVALVLLGITASPAPYAAPFGANVLQPPSRKEPGIPIVVRIRVDPAASDLASSARVSRQRPSAAKQSPRYSPLLPSGYPQDTPASPTYSGLCAVTRRLTIQPPRHSRLSGSVRTQSTITQANNPPSARSLPPAGMGSGPTVRVEMARA